MVKNPGVQAVHIDAELPLKLPEAQFRQDCVALGVNNPAVQGVHAGMPPTLNEPKAHGEHAVLLADVLNVPAGQL